MCTVLEHFQGQWLQMHIQVSCSTWTHHIQKGQPVNQTPFSLRGLTMIVAGAWKVCRVPWSISHVLTLLPAFNSHHPHQCSFSQHHSCWPNPNRGAIISNRQASKIHPRVSLWAWLGGKLHTVQTEHIWVKCIAESKKHTAPHSSWSGFPEISILLLQHGPALQCVVIGCYPKQHERGRLSRLLSHTEWKPVAFLLPLYRQHVLTHWLSMTRSCPEPCEYTNALSCMVDLCITTQTSPMYSSLELNTTACWFHTDTPPWLTNINRLCLLFPLCGHYGSVQSSSRKPLVHPNAASLLLCSPSTSGAEDSPRGASSAPSPAPNWDVEQS